jgi:predicted RecB family nuclease
MKMNPRLFEAFLKCPTKCFLRSTGLPELGNAYADWVQSQNDAYRNEAATRLLKGSQENESSFAPLATESFKSAMWRLAVDVLAQTENLESRLQGVEHVPSKGRGTPAEFIPVRFIRSNKLTKEDRLILAFDALVLSQMLGRKVRLGKIIHGHDHATLRIKVASLLDTVKKLVGKMAALLAIGSPPDLILNRHCAECEFRDRCRQKAVEKDELTLLSGMSEKERKKFHGKGIFTVTQLSYTFRPRKRPKRLRGTREKYHHSIKALAIREKKIHIVGSPEFKIDGMPVYLDVEGLPDVDFYYLIGLRVGNGESAIQYTLWADSSEDERTIWKDFLCILETIENPVLIHYGSYETAFLKKMSERYGGPREGSVAVRATSSAVNVISLIFSHIYFPTFSNSLKDVAGWLGYRWSETNRTGLQTIVWREKCATSHGNTERMQLTRYNAEDCAALELVTNTILGLNRRQSFSETGSEAQVVDVTSLKRESPYGFKRNTFAIPELDAINKAAYWNYQRERVYIRSNHGVRRALRRTCHNRRTLRPNRFVQCPRPLRCPH